MTYMPIKRLVLLLVMVGALALAGCGGGSDNGGLSPDNMADLAPAEPEPELPAMEPDELPEQVEAADPGADTPDPDGSQDQAEAADPEADTSDVDAAIAALQAQIDVLIGRTRDAATALEILGGTEGVMSANDRAALAVKIAGELNDRYDHDGDGAIVNLPEIQEHHPGFHQELPPQRIIKWTRDVPLASNLPVDGMTKIMTDAGGFLKHAFKSGTEVDLTSPGDVETLKLRSLLEVDGVELMSFSLRETDKVLVEAGRLTDTFDGSTRIRTFSNVPCPNAPSSAGCGNNTASATQITALGADGSKSVVATEDLGPTAQPVNEIVGNTANSFTVTYVGSNRIVETLGPRIGRIYSWGTGAGDFEHPPAVFTRGSDGAVAYFDQYGVGNVGPYDYWHRNGQGGGREWIPVSRWLQILAGETPQGGHSFEPSVAKDHALALQAYKDSTYPIAQHAAAGWGAWLEDSFFMAYAIHAEDDSVINDPDEAAFKFAWGARRHDAEPARTLSGLGDTAAWKGLMVGHDVDAEAATYGDLLQGNASITAYLGGGAPANGRASLVDVSLTNIVNDAGVRVPRVEDGIHWTNVELGRLPGDPYVSFGSGKELLGRFYAGGGEVVGQFDKHDIVGVFGAVEAEVMDDAMMAGQ